MDGKKDSEQTETVSTTTKSQEEFIEETVAKRKFIQFVQVLLHFLKNEQIKNCFLFLFSVLQKAGRHMEHTLIAAYVVLLLGYLVMDNKVRFFKQKIVFLC